MMETNKYPRLERVPQGVEVPCVKNGRPGYRWAPGWRVRYSETRTGGATTYRDAQHELSQSKETQK